MTPDEILEQQRIIKTGDGLAAYKFDRDVDGADIAAMQKVVLAHGDAEDACFFACVVDGELDISALQKMVLDSKDGYLSTYFACDLQGCCELKESDIEALQAITLEYGDGVDACKFALGVKGADIKALQQVVIDRGDAFDAYAFARDVEGSDVVKLYERAEVVRFKKLTPEEAEGFREMADNAADDTPSMSM